MRWERVAVHGGGGPGKRWGHTCNAVQGGRLLYVFGGFGDDNRHTNKVHVFDTVNRMWSEPLTKGALPAPRDSHSCTTVGDNLFVFGGTTGRESLNDLHILDTSLNTWMSPCQRGDRPTPREGHSAALIGKRLFIFGGCGNFRGAEIFYDDVYVLNTAAGTWSEVMPTGEGPSARFSVAGDCLDPHLGGSLVFVGGCDKNLQPLEDMYYLHTGLFREAEREERRIEKLSLRKQLKLKCQEQQASASPYDNAPLEFNINANVHHQLPVNYAQPSRHNIYLNEYQTPLGKKTFQAKVTKGFPGGYTVETVIDGKRLRGVLFSNKPRPEQTPCNDSIRNMGSGETDRENQNGDHNSVREVTRPSEPNINDLQQADVSGGNSTRNEASVGDATAEMKSPFPSYASSAHEVHDMSHDVNLEGSMVTDAIDCGTKGL